MGGINENACCFSEVCDLFSLFFYVFFVVVVAVVVTAALLFIFVELQHLSVYGGQCTRQGFLF